MNKVINHNGNSGNGEGLLCEVHMELLEKEV